MKIYKQPFLYRKWSVTNPSKAMRILHKLTFGALGSIPMVELEEKEMYTCYTGAPCNDDRKFNNAAMKHINCRCSMNMVSDKVNPSN